MKTSIGSTWLVGFGMVVCFVCGFFFSWGRGVVSVVADGVGVFLH